MKPEALTQLALVTTAALTLASCGNTVEGIKQDTNELIYHSKVVVIDTTDATKRKAGQLVVKSAEAVKTRAEAVLAASE